MIITAIDPGSDKSAFVYWDTETERVGRHGIVPNEVLVDELTTIWRDSLVIEDMQWRGFTKGVGKEVFPTLIWIGQFKQAGRLTNCEIFLLKRPAIKKHMLGKVIGTDGEVRHAILWRFGGTEKAIGTKAAPGPVYGLRTHEWQALAVALTHADMTARPGGGGGTDAKTPGIQADLG